MSNRSRKSATVIALVLMGLVAWGASALMPPTAPTSIDTTMSSTTSAVAASQDSAAGAEPPSVAPRSVVTEVVDGDTVVVDGATRVRLIGIDTPERGTPGYHESTAALAALVGGRQVVLVGGARDDSDRYGRLLRYIEVDGEDANLEMLRSGHARSRYDSRDGYGTHAREAAYIAADLAAPDLWAQTTSVVSTSAPLPAPGGPSGTAGQDARFGTCKEAIANGFGPYVAGVDPEYDWYRDGDGDGIVCET